MLSVGVMVMSCSRHFHPAEHGVSILPARSSLSPEQPHLQSRLLNFEPEGQSILKPWLSSPPLFTHQLRL